MNYELLFVRTIGVTDGSTGGTRIPHFFSFTARERRGGKGEKFRTPNFRSKVTPLVRPINYLYSVSDTQQSLLCYKSQSNTLIYIPLVFRNDWNDFVTSSLFNA
jgi:hypothetical protein